MYKVVVSLILILMFITGCVQSETLNQQNEGSNLIHKDHPNNTIIQKENYQKILKEVKNKQSEYINSLPAEDQSSVQSVFSAMLNKATELQDKNPNDKAIIDEILADLSEDLLKTNVANLSDIQVIMKKYELERNTTFIEVTPASIRNYYDLAVPDQALSDVYLNENQISFQITDSYKRTCKINCVKSPKEIK